MAFCLAGQLFLSVALKDQSLRSARVLSSPRHPQPCAPLSLPSCAAREVLSRKGSWDFQLTPMYWILVFFFFFLFLSHVLSVGDWKGFITEFPECAYAQIQSCWKARKPRVCGAGPDMDVHTALWTPRSVSVKSLHALCCCVVLPGMTGCRCSLHRCPCLLRNGQRGILHASVLSGLERGG